MAEQTITKTKKVKGETVSTTYRIDADFVPTKIADISNEFIENYCVAHNQLDWLCEVVNTPSYTVQKKDKETGERRTVTVKCDNYPFVNLRRDFAVKFFPSIVGQAPAKAETFKERINRIYGKK